MTSFTVIFHSRRAFNKVPMSVLTKPSLSDAVDYCNNIKHPDNRSRMQIHEMDDSKVVNVFDCTGTKAGTK